MNKNYLLILASVLFLKVSSQVTLYEGFTAPFNPAANGWDIQNLSSPTGTNATGWRQGNATQYFNALSGAPDDYFSIDKYSTSSAGTTNTISCWLITPTLNLVNGATIQFTTKNFQNNPVKPERLQVYYSMGTGNNVGNSVGTATNTAGTFTNLIADLNANLSPNFSLLWSWATTYSLSGITTPGVGRIAFRYYIPNGGDSGPNGNYIGLDEVRYQMPCTRPGFFGDVTATFTVCTNSSTQLKIYPSGLTPPTTYTWFNGATTSLTAYTPTISGVQEIWSLGQNAAGCQHLDISYVNVQASPTITALLDPGSTVCSGKSVSVSTTGANTYTYFLGTNSFTSNPIILTANTVTTPTTSHYTVTGRTANGCTASQVQSLTINPNPTITAVPSKTNICINTTTTLTANGASTYSWAGAASSTASSFSFTGTTTGTQQFTVYGVSQLGCKSAEVVASMSVSSCTGINEIEKSSSVAVYPNPFEEKVIIENFNGQVKFFNLQGQVLYEAEGTQSIIVNTSSLQAGIYILKTCDSLGTQKTFRLIKN